MNIINARKKIAQSLKTKRYKIALLGLGLDNLAFLKLLDAQNNDAEITICDFRQKNLLPNIQLKNIAPHYRLGPEFNQNLSDFDLLLRSPGWPIACPGIQTALKTKKTKLSSAINIFFEASPSKKIIAVSGSKGKGTTASLIYKILEAQEKNIYQKKLKQEKKAKLNKVFLAGNIGISPLSLIDQITTNDYVVLELSSFQLEDLNISPKIGIITNLFKEHLSPADPQNPNYHKNLDRYWQAKLNIANHKDNHVLIINENLRSKINKNSFIKPANQVNTSKKKIIFFSATEFIPSKLQGDYNQENIAAVIALAKYLKISPKLYLEIIKNFKNLNHRLEFVKEINGVRYFDNSFSTTPDSTTLDLLSFPKNKIIQIAGGADKGSDFLDLAKTIKERVKLLILLPGAGTDKIKLALKQINFDDKKIILAKDMEQAVSLAKKHAKRDDIVLLSTACASFGIFKNYKERGGLFQKYVKAKN